MQDPKPQELVLTSNHGPQSDAETHTLRKGLTIAYRIRNSHVMRGFAVKSIVCIASERAAGEEYRKAVHSAGSWLPGARLLQ